MNPFRRCLVLALVLVGLAHASLAADQAYTIAVIPKGTTHEFWRSVHAGAVKAQRELKDKGINVEIIWKGPLREDDRDLQMQVVENFMTRRVNGIVLAPLDSQALVAPVANAVRAKIPVVIFDSGLKSDKITSFVATDNYKGGAMAAERLGELLKGQGNVILLRYGVGSASTEARETGFLETLKAKFPGLKVISSDQYAGPTRETAYQASQNLLNRYGSKVNGIFAPNEGSTVGMTKALKDIGKAGGKVKMVGFDTGVQSVIDLKNGDVQGLVVQDPMRMGYLALMTMVNHLRGEKVEARIDTGVHLITPDNMNQPDMQDFIHPPFEKYVN